MELNTGKLRPTRFAHIQGHTNVSYSKDGKYIITCGLDGEVRIFEGLDDDDCKTYPVADKCHCLAYKDDCLLIGTDLNMIQSYTMDEGKPNGIITRFTSVPTHIKVSSNRNIVAAASSDMTIKVHDSVNFKDTLFSGHEAPVLSVAIDPLGDFLASSSCDGTVRIWNFRTQSVVRSFPLFEKCNDFNFSKTLCRINFTHDGKYLMVPIDSEIYVYDRSTWKVSFKLSHSSIDSIISVTDISPCGTFISGGCRNGRIVIWNLKTKDCILSEKPMNGIAVTDITWNPSCNTELAFVNNQGEMGTVENILVKGDSSTDKIAAPIQEGPFENDGFDDNDLAESENEFSLAKIKSQLGFADDEEGTFLGLPKNSEDAEESRAPSRMETPVIPPVVAAPKLPEPQNPFQPGMAPEHLSDRYMVWNNTGIVRQYKSEEENSIEVEFHDSSIHHPFHLNNINGYSMAALNDQALVLAVEGREDQLSKLAVHHFSVWEGNKEWEIDIPEGEDILALGIGEGWIAAATDKRNLRIFSTSGFQRDLLCVPGPIVCLAGWKDYIMILYHTGIGVLGEQCISTLVLSVSGGRHLMATPVQIPLSPNSFVAWAGFTDEGSPMIMDSAGMIKICSRKNGHIWTCILNTRQFVKGKSDHYFLIGSNEIQSVVRCILCRGSRYPPSIPRPQVMLLEFKLPLCEVEGEKGILEENLLRNRLLSATTERLGKHGLDVETIEAEVERKLKENMIKLFALACRSDRESRAFEVCESIPSYESINVAVKYATKIHRMQLAERLSDLVQKKMEENITQDMEDESAVSFTSGMNFSSANDQNGFNSESYSAEDYGDLSNNNKENSITNNPLLNASSRKNTKDPSLSNNFSGMDRNPFKKSRTLSPSTSKGFEHLNTLKINKKEENNLVLRPIMRKPKNKQSMAQSSLNKIIGKEIKDKNSVATSANETEPSTDVKNSPQTAPKKVSALKLWLNDNKLLVKEKYPDIDNETELLVKAALLFKDIDESIKQKYKKLAATPQSTDSSRINSEFEDNKRKFEKNAEGQPLEKKQRSGVAKLADFAFINKES